MAPRDLADLAQRRCPRRPRVGSGGFGQRRRAPTRSSASTPLSSSPSALTRRETSCIAAIASLASSPAFLACAIALRGLVLLARAAPRPPAAASRRRASSVEHPSSRASEPSRRRASAARTGSGSRRMALRSSTAAPAARPLRGGSACSRLAGGSCGRRGPRGLGPEYFAMKSATSCASSPVTMFCGIGPDEKPPLLDRVQDVARAAPCAGRSSGRPCTRASLTSVAEPCRAGHVERVAAAAVLRRRAPRPRGSGRSRPASALRAARAQRPAAAAQAARRGAMRCGGAAS